MKVIITAGGTGGHIYPALAIVDKIKEMEPESEFIYIGTHNRMESEIVPKRGLKYIPLEIYGLSTSIKLMGRNIKNVFLIKKAIKKCKEIIKDFKPDIAIGVGGYVTFPVIYAAHKCGVKTFIHEQNSIPGKANKLLLKSTDLVGVSFKSSLKYFKTNEVILTGNPCSSQSLKIKKADKKEYGINKKCVLIFNGSLGSSVMNEKLKPFLEGIENKDYEVLYITGKNYYEEYSKNKFPKNVHIVPYIDNLSALMKDMDIIVSRAGASSVAEISALGIPTIFIPSPYVANNHQYYNALSITEENAGLMIEEKDLNKDILIEDIDKLFGDEEYYHEISNNLKKLSINDSSTIIYNAIKDLIK